MVIEGGKDVTNLQIDQLMKKISQKDSSALEALYKAMSKPIYFYVLHLTGNPHIAEDVMQDTFVIVLQKSHLYKEKGKGRSWLFTIAKNLTVDIQRKQNRIDSDEINPETVIDDDFAYRSDTGITALKMLDSLNSKEREIVMLRLLSDMTLTEVSAELNIPKGTVFWTYNNAIKKIKKQFAGGDIIEE